MTEKLFQGKWEITEMDAWKVKPGWTIEFDGSGNGALHFLYVDVYLDYSVDNKKSPNRADFSFSGSDECDETHGRGWVKVNGKSLTGNIAFHRGEKSGFKAQKK